VTGRKEFFYFRLYPFKTSLIPAELETKRNFIEQMNREIDSLVLAWRHKVDHAANHLAIIRNAEFTPDVAKHIIGAVCVFMLRLVDVRVIRIIVQRITKQHVKFSATVIFQDGESSGLNTERLAFPTASRNDGVWY